MQAWLQVLACSVGLRLVQAVQAVLLVQSWAAGAARLHEAALRAWEAAGAATAQSLQPAQPTQQVSRLLCDVAMTMQRWHVCARATASREMQQT